MGNGNTRYGDDDILAKMKEEIDAKEWKLLEERHGKDTVDIAKNFELLLDKYGYYEVLKVACAYTIMLGNVNRNTNFVEHGLDLKELIDTINPELGKK